MANATPIEATIFAYQVGFGDCFLLRFTYSDQSRRHILIDFGTTGRPKNSERDLMVKVAKDIKVKCTENGGNLDVVVATHRHADHISGFSTEQGAHSSGNIIRALKPKVVLQPWTEDPKAPKDSLGPIKSGKKAVLARLQSLRDMQVTAERVVQLIPIKKGIAAESVERGKDVSFANAHKMRLQGLHQRLRFIGEDNISNKSAVENLRKMGEKRVYAYHGCDAGLSTILPGVKSHVLGPPTLRQTETIKKQRSKDPDQFWHLTAKRLSKSGPIQTRSRKLFPDAETYRAGRLPTEYRWISERIDEANSEELLGIVRALDKQMNNTSLILLFQAGNKTLLFPGDAQIENWAYALDSKYAAMLKDVDLYKVGHHGSLNATPKQMWGLFGKRGNKKKKDRMTSVMSTMAGKHGHSEDKTEVPRRSLVKALQSETHHHTTEQIPEEQLYHQITLKLQ